MAQSSWPMPVISLLSPEGRGACARRTRPRVHATSCLLACVAPRTDPREPSGSLRPPRHSLPRPHPLPWISLSRARQLPSPPSTNRSATGPPSLPQLAHQLRHSILTLPAISRDRRSPEAPSRRFSPPRPPRTAAVDSPPSPPPRACRLLQPTPRELLFLLPLPVLTLEHHNNCTEFGRNLPPPVTAADVPPAT